TQQRAGEHIPQTQENRNHTRCSRSIRGRLFAEFDFWEDYIASREPFVFRFGQFVIVRILRVKKKYEIWFLFAGKPVRMSLHEFARVTGLNCKKIPPKNNKRKKKNPIKEKLYWEELFGSLKFCLNRMTRLKYTCLAFTSCVLLPTSHYPRIIPEHVEMIRDLEEFLAFPWGRVAFEMLVTGIKKKDEIILSQTNIALPGFVDAIQLVFMEAVPQIKEVVPQPENVVVIESDSESDTEGGDSQAEVEEDEVVVRPGTPPAAVRYYVNPAHVKSLDEDEKTQVISLFEDTAHYPDDLTWEDEAVDVAVDELVRLTKEGYTFKNTMFVGGLTAVELNLPDSPDTEASEPGDQNQMARDVANLLKPLINDSVSNESERLEVKLAAVIKDEVQKMQGAVIQSIIDLMGKSISANKGVGGKTTHSRPIPSAPTNNATREEAKDTSTENDTTDEITNTEPSNTTKITAHIVDETNADTIINDVVLDVQSLGNSKEVDDTNLIQQQKVQTPPHAQPTANEEECSEDDERLTFPVTVNLSDSNYNCQIEFLLSLIEIPTFSLGLSQEDVGPLNNAQPPMTREGICETRKSKRTRTLPPIFNDYQYDPKIKSFRTEENAYPQDNNVEEVYLSMRDSAGQNKYLAQNETNLILNNYTNMFNRVFTVGNGVSLSTEELDCIVDLSQQMPPKVLYCDHLPNVKAN
ncbi:LOW QUALITY PROTEIN: hypothetical protein HID58_014605, partial [Brassica napus]